MMDVECWILDSFRIKNRSFKISQPVRSVRFQEIMGCFNFGFWMEFSIQHLKFKILPWSQGFSEVVLTMDVRIF
jgi:hypothetical protein